MVNTALRPGSDEARALVREIRDAHPPVDGELLMIARTGRHAPHGSVELVAANLAEAHGLAWRMSTSTT